MSDRNGDPLYRVDRTLHVHAELERLGRRAQAVGMAEHYFDAVRAIVRLLETEPLEWGDPEHHTRLPGGLVCHGIKEPLFVRYAVYEAERIVLVFYVEAVPYSYLRRE